MKNIVGLPTRGENFYPRPKEVKKIVESLSNGNNIQITAPRRVGKTSILLYLVDNDVEKRRYVYIDTESVDNEQEFFKKLLQEILHHDQIGKSNKLKNSFTEGANRFLKKIKSVKILNTGFELNHDAEAPNYYDELQNFLLGYAIEEQVELVILIDEFPQTIENIKSKSEDDAVAFLKKNRALRLNPETSKLVKYIYTGSIGLNQTVSRLNASATINDVNSIEVGPLTEKDAKGLFNELLLPYSRVVQEGAEKKLLEIIQWYIPFHIQLIVQEIVQQTEEGDEVDSGVVEKSVDCIVALKNQNHFDHYYTRLKTQFKGSAYGYADELLKEIAQNDSADKLRVADLAAKYNVEGEYKSIVETLMYDGYIHFIDSTKEYRFNSPIVKRWWLKFIC